MSNRDWLLIFVWIYTIGVLCQQVYSSQKEYKQKIISNWSSYKKNYMKYINQEDDGNA